MTSLVTTDERGFPIVVKGKINVGAVSQAHHASGSDSASSVAVGDTRALDGFFANDLDPTTKHRVI